MRDVLVVCYHTIGSEWQHPMSVAPQQFERQLDWLLGHGYRPMTFSDALLSPGEEKRVAITFDDAFRQVYRRVFPLLQERNVPATVFAPTQFIGSEQPLSWSDMDSSAAPATELLPMSWRELYELAESGWEVGSHSNSHVKLGALSDEQVHEELRVSRDICEQHLSRPCRSVAYPFGDVDERVAAAASDAGFEAGAALARPPGKLDVLMWPRIGVYPKDTVRRFRLKASRVARSAAFAAARRAQA